MVGRKNYYGSGSVVSAQLASRVFTITATATRAGLNPLSYLRAILDECAQAGGAAPTGAALTRFLPWAVNTEDRTAWARDPKPQPDTDSEPRAGPAPQRPTDRDGRVGRRTAPPARLRGAVTHPPMTIGGLITQPEPWHKGSRRDSSAHGITECLPTTSSVEAETTHLPGIVAPRAPRGVDM